MQAYISGLLNVLQVLELKDVKYLMRCILQAKRIWVIGNGGSMSTATHFAEDLLKLAGKKASSISDSSLLSMSGNDEGFENVFLYPLKTLVEKGDLVIGITTSGKSPNILKVMSSNELGCDKFLITGLGGKNLKVSKILIPCKDVQICEDVSLVICHLVCKFIEEERK